MILPLSLPGVFAGSLLVFIPAAGDFVNAVFLGSPQTTMIGNVVQNQFLVQANYPVAAALSLVLMAIITVGVLVYSRCSAPKGWPPDGRHRRSRHHRRDVGRRRHAHRPGRPLGTGAVVDRPMALTIYAVLGFIYLFLPILWIVGFSFNDPTGRFNYSWSEFTLDNWADPFP